MLNLFLGFLPSGDIVYVKYGSTTGHLDIQLLEAQIVDNTSNIGHNRSLINSSRTSQRGVDSAQDVKIEKNRSDIAALPSVGITTGQISADEAKITANEGNIATNTTNIAANAHEIVSLSTGSVQSNINAVARLGGKINTLDEKVFTTSQTPGVAATDNILTNKNAIAKNKADIAATPSLVAHDAKEDKILRLTSSPNSPVAPSLLTAVTSGFVDPIYSTRVDFTSLVYNSTPPIQYTLALTEAPSLRIVKVGNNPPPKDAIFFPEGSLYITAKAGRVAADVPQTITLTFPSTVVTYTRPTKEPETITIVGPHFTVVLEKYTYNFSGTAHALIPIGVGGVITTTGGTFEIDDMDVVEGNKGQRIIQVSVDKKLDIIWEKETTGVVADWFKLSTVGLDVAANTKGIAKNKADIAALPSGGTSSGDKEDNILQGNKNPNGDVFADPVLSGSFKIYSSSTTWGGWYSGRDRHPVVIVNKALRVTGSGATVPAYVVLEGSTIIIPNSTNITALQVPQTITFRNVGNAGNYVLSAPVRDTSLGLGSIETNMPADLYIYTSYWHL